MNGAGYRTTFNPDVTYYVSTNVSPTGLGSQYSTFGDGYVPYTVIVGRDRKVYFSMSGYDDVEARAAIDRAIADYNGLVYVANPISDKLYQYSATEVLDVSNVFDQYEIEPVSVSIVSNSNPAVVTATMSKANTLNLTASSSSTGTATIILEGTDIDNNKAQTEFTVTVYDPDPQYSSIEDFEDGNFTGNFVWTLTNSGNPNRNWTVATTSPFEGTRCAQTGSVSDSGWDAIELSVTYAYDGIIVFNQKTSSELDWDWLIFTIDGVEQGRLSGLTGWENEFYSVSAGTHAFKWTYIKDDNTDGGTDQAWLDYVQFIEIPPQANLAAPTNVVASSSVSNISLTWDVVSGATSYNIYSSTDPYGTFTVDNSGTFNGTEWTSALTETKKFYYVTAANSKGKSSQSNIVETPSAKKIKGVLLK